MSAPVAHPKWRGCSCLFDPEYHQDRNESGDSRCLNEIEPGEAFCTACLFGCMP